MSAYDEARALFAQLVNATTDLYLTRTGDPRVDEIRRATMADIRARTAELEACANSLARPEIAKEGR